MSDRNRRTLPAALGAAVLLLLHLGCESSGPAEPLQPRETVHFEAELDRIEQDGEAWFVLQPDDSDLAWEPINFPEEIAEAGMRFRVVGKTRPDLPPRGAVAKLELIVMERK